MEREFITNSSDETVLLGEKIIKVLKAPVTILLEGDLASGKTTLTKGLAKGVGIKDVINSPSFTIMKEYITNNNILFHHYDFYRMEDVGNDFDLLDYLEDGYNIIEWPNQAQSLLPKKHLKIIFEKISDNSRKLILKSDSDEIIKEISCIA